jgi:hypothetical protein
MRPALVAFCGLLVHRIQNHRRSDVRLLMSVPADSDGITLDWLTAALREAGAIYHARVTSIQSGPVGHMGLTGQLRRLRISYDKAEPGAPSSLLAKFSAQNPENRAAVHSMGFTNVRSASIVSSLLIARSARLGVISARWRWAAERRCFCLRISPGCATSTPQVGLSTR